MFESKSLKQIRDIKQDLSTSNTEESVNNALNRLSELMDNLVNDIQLTDIKGILADIQGSTRSAKLHDITRSKMIDMLQKLLEKAGEIIMEEKQKELARKLQTLFSELAEHSEEISKIIDIEKILG